MTIQTEAVSPAALLEDVLRRRRSVRAFTGEPLDDECLLRLAWAAQGVSDREGRRTAPSAGAMYPLEVYAVTETALSRYDPPTNSLVPLATEDRRPALQAAVGQDVIGAAPLTIVLAGVISRMAPRFQGSKADRFLCLEVGHAAQNVLLEAVALDLAGLTVGSFDAVAVQRALDLPPDQEPIELLAVGRPA